MKRERISQFRREYAIQQLRELLPSILTASAIIIGLIFWFAVQPYLYYRNATHSQVRQVQGIVRKVGHEPMTLEGWQGDLVDVQTASGDIVTRVYDNYRVGDSVIVYYETGADGRRYNVGLKHISSVAH